MELSFVHTVAFAGVVLIVGGRIRSLLPWLARYNVPSAVLGGLVAALAHWLWRAYSLPAVSFDTSLREPLMIAFFTTIGFGASVGVLRRGGALLVLFLAIATVAALMQNVVGAAAAMLLGHSPLLGVLCGSVTLTGGPATGLAFAPQFEQAGIAGASEIAIAAAMLGIISGGLLGAPIGTLLVERLRPAPVAMPSDPDARSALQIVEGQLPTPAVAAAAGEDAESHTLLYSLIAILFAMWAGSAVALLLTAAGLTLPSYIGAMIVAAMMRAFDDATGWLRLSQTPIDHLGHCALSLFLVLAMMTLDLTLLASAALPLLALLGLQLLLIAILCRWVVFPRMGRNYEAAVMASGFCGFMMGTTANAMANMDALVRRYGPAPQAFLIVPTVGAFFIDFVNAVLIQGFLNAMH